MAAITITAANVVSSATTTKGTAGETIAAGQALYKKAADSKLYLAQADGTAAEAEFVGIAANGGAAGQPVNYYGAGAEITTQAAAFTAAGMWLYVHGTAGSIGEISELASTNYYTLVGYSTATNKFMLFPKATGLQMP